MAQQPWHNNHGTTIIAQQPWHNNHGTTTMAQQPWHNNHGTHPDPGGFHDSFTGHAGRNPLKIFLKKVPSKNYSISLSVL
jgi:hypothetical protein